MTMREKMARAMYERMRSRVPIGVFGARLPWAEEPERLRDHWCSAADAALDALMEPTEGMIEAAAEKIGADRPEHHGYSDQHLAIVGMNAALRAAKDGK